MPTAPLPGIAETLGVPVHDLVEEQEDVILAPDRAASQAEATFARRVVEVLERPLTAPDLMALLSEAQVRLRTDGGDTG